MLLVFDRSCNGRMKEPAKFASEEQMLRRKPDPDEKWFWANEVTYRAEPFVLRESTPL